MFIKTLQPGKLLKELLATLREAPEKKSAAHKVNFVVVVTDAPGMQANNLPQNVDISLALEEIAKLKEGTANLDSKFTELKSQTNEFIKTVNEDTGILVSASLVKTIPYLEQRVKTLEEATEKKRNWYVNGWLLALTIISTGAAIWALFVR